MSTCRHPEGSTLRVCTQLADFCLHFSCLLSLQRLLPPTVHSWRTKRSQLLQVWWQLATYSRHQELNHVTKHTVFLLALLPQLLNCAVGFVVVRSKPFV